ncbi:MAG: hypothetical protein GF400_09690 [Candidatus Eisenbacteria bacterium]|nr:hypothetical protein [Candidatus Eisenbacteria bacterium]
MPLFDYLKRGIDAASAMKAATSGSGKKRRPYVIGIELHVQAPNKKMLDNATKMLRDRASDVGPAVLKFLGLGDDVVLGDVEVEIKKDG